uniref:PDZ domain-containing protein n=1 Tax=Ciona savignyi TaxID=51511 RepID=H2ZI94_CIOSA
MATPRIQTSVTLFGSPPWGFRISGGKEYNQPLVFTRITPGSLAARSGLTSGDVLIAVNGQHVADMTQDICETKIKQAVGSIQFVIQKNAAVMSQNASGEVVLESDRSVYTRDASEKERIARHNRSAKPFASQTPATKSANGFRSVSFQPKPATPTTGGDIDTNCNLDSAVCNETMDL